MMDWLADGFGSNAPNRVTTTPGLERSVAKAGRSVNSESPLASLPVVILNGRPERTLIKGLTCRPKGAFAVPLTKNRCRTSVADRPYSVLRSYWLAGNEPGPSVLAKAWP